MTPGREGPPVLRVWPARVLAAVVVVSVIAIMSRAEVGAQRQSRRDLEQRFAVRATTAATFIESSSAYTLRRESELAADRLAAETVTAREFGDFRDIFGFGPAVLLDEDGRVLRVAPAAPELVDVDLARRYDHLREATEGRGAVSDAVPSTDDDVLIVAFAAPFDTPSGRRVISGAYDLATRSMGEYLRHALPFQESEAYLVDSQGRVLASQSGDAGSLDVVDPAVARAVAAAPSGHFDPEDGRNGRFYVAEPVPGTPWQIVMAVAEDELYRPLDRSGRFLPWVFLGAFALAASVLAAILVHGRESRRRLRIDATTDLLTALPNRRALEAALDRVLAALGPDDDFAVLVVDVDHFKRVNDRYGHQVGDVALTEIAARIAASVRDRDIAGRWGGEEFLVVLPRTGLSGALAVAERIRRAVAAEPVETDGASIPVTVSIGAAVRGPDESASDVVLGADANLYLAKDSGRNCIRPAPATSDPDRVIAQTGLPTRR